MAFGPVLGELTRTHLYPGDADNIQARSSFARLDDFSPHISSPSPSASPFSSSSTDADSEFDDSDTESDDLPASSHDVQALLTQIRSLTTRLSALETPASGKKSWLAALPGMAGTEQMTMSAGLGVVTALAAAGGAAVAVALVGAWGRRKR